jgi:hypothetical protein
LLEKLQIDCAQGKNPSSNDEMKQEQTGSLNLFHFTDLLRVRKGKIQSQTIRLNKSPPLLLLNRSLTHQTAPVTGETITLKKRRSVSYVFFMDFP